MFDDLDQRVPCPDGRCVGAIGAGGRCGTCGRTAAEAAAVDGGVAAPDSSPAAKPDLAWFLRDEEGPLDLDARRLCPDGACIGVIGDDGRCKECGRAAEG